MTDRGPVFDGVKIGRPATGALIDAGYRTLTDLPADLRDLLALHGVGPSAITRLTEARARESGPDSAPAPDPGADRKTRPTDTAAEAALAGVGDPRRRTDAEAVLAMMREVTGAEPVVWGSSIIGFGQQPYTTADGKEREWFAVGLAARKTALTLYGLTYYGSHTGILERLGPHTTGKGCLYIKRLDAINSEVLRDLIARSWSENHRPA
ncbi:DUF1801 domain-containing protein [Nocardioides insulae]|uniref:DUF1801 domain-containing protein n=1 Tax=Nocardioides insulae TaxID=394734 RepID=UPI0004044780|nr:DUF1801 domain-containing protein [Nocardioides insulae]